jgi:hypothetical protein
MAALVRNKIPAVQADGIISKSSLPETNISPMKKYRYVRELVYAIHPSIESTNALSTWEKQYFAIRECMESCGRIVLD